MGWHHRKPPGIIDEPGIGKRPGGALYLEKITKISSFARACSEDGVPLIWLQDISGFDIGEQAEAQGLLGYGSSLIYANSTPRNPVFTVLLRRPPGAGFYAMSGMPLRTHRAVEYSDFTASCDGRSNPGDSYIQLKVERRLRDCHRRSRAASRDRRGMARAESRIQSDMDPVRAAASMDTDEVVCFDELRAWCLTEAARGRAQVTVGRRTHESGPCMTYAVLAVWSQEHPPLP